MPHAVVRPDTLYAWSGQSLLVVNTGGECADDQRLTGYYFRETRFLRTLQLRINGHPPWPCEAASIAPDTLLFTYVHPEITMPSGGGTGQAGDEENTDRDGVPERAIDICVTYTVRAGWLDVRTVVANRAANRGAGVVLAARNENDLRAACHEIRQHGGRAVYVVADVSRPEDVKRIGEAAIAEFGRIDTWVNNAAVSTYEDVRNSARRHAAADGRELLEPGLRLPRGRQPSVAVRRGAGERRQWYCRPRDSAAGDLLRGQACVEGVLGRAAIGA